MSDVTDATFSTAVVERSHTVPVVVDLWAPWCGPCQTLGPILERVIGETNGLVELAKINVDENPQVSQAFQVQSIPAVYAMRDGQIVDGFMGAQGEPAIVEFVQRLLDADVSVAGDDGEPGETPEVVPDDSPTETEEPVEITPAEADLIVAELESLLAVVKTDEAARERYLELLDQLGPADERTNTYRRRLASALY